MALVITIDSIQPQDYELLLNAMPSYGNFPQHTRQQALDLLPRICKETKESGDHFKSKTDEFHRNDLIHAFRIGVHLEYVQEHGLYLPTYQSTIEMGSDLTGLK